MTGPVRVSVQATPADAASWAALAADLDDGSFDTLYVPDHPGTTPAPFVALAAAASVTERIRLGTCVVNAGMWDPLALASEVATLDLVSGGRALLGVGAGHTPAEWTATGRRFPRAAERVERMEELVTLTRALLDGEHVTHQGSHLSLVDAALDVAPARRPVPVLVGGNGSRVLRFAARHADVVGLTGLGRTLADGHRHAVDWSAGAIRQTVDAVQRAASAAGRRPALEALVQVIAITDDAEGFAAQVAEQVEGLTAADALSAPYAWIGTVEEIAGRLRAHRTELGIERYVVREPAVPDARQVLTALDR